MRTNRTAALGVVALVATLAGCGISQGTRNFAEEVNGQIQRREQEIEQTRKELADFLASPESEGFRQAAEREQWAQRIEIAAGKVSAARSTYDQKVKPILDADDSGREYEVYEPLDQIGPILESTREESGFWRARRDGMVELKSKIDVARQQMRNHVASTEAAMEQLRPQAAAAKREFPDQADAISALVTPLEGRLEASQSALQGFEAEYRKHESGSGADYGLMYALAGLMQMNDQNVAQAANEAEAKFAELSTSYARTLVDMKAEYFLTVRRQSWDNNVDYPSLHDYDYPQRQVDAPTMDYFDDISSSLATYKRGWFGNDLNLFPNVDKAKWDALKIDPEEQWPSSDDDEAELWLQDTTAKYYHKYHVVQNGETSETDWVEVEEAFFLANLDNLGMDVEAKPYGVFESEKMTQAAPPGMAYVGNERYGRWERSNGGMMWTWIAPYLFYRSLFGNPWMYSRNEYTTFRNGYYGSRPYYGTGSTPMYGTRSSRTQSSPTLAGSTFGRSGGFSRAPSSVRGAGPAGRGGGFGGSGK